MKNIGTKSINMIDITGYRVFQKNCEIRKFFYYIKFLGKNFMFLKIEVCPVVLNIITFHS